MNVEEARAGLLSDATEERLRAARHFSTRAKVEDRPFLSEALAKENVVWIKRALRSAIERIDRQKAVIETAPTEDGELLAGLDASQIFAKAAEEVADSIVHEFSPIVGLLRVVVPMEVGETYGESRSKKLLDQLQGLLRAVRALRRASAAPQFTTFALGAFITDIVDSTPNEGHVAIRQAGSPRLMVTADKDQLGIAVANGLRNALEAVRTFSSTQPPQVVINWGSTQADNYLVIKDTGPGFHGDPMAALKLGATSKSGHPGFGLTLAHQAMRSMQGDIQLKNDGDGAHFEIRWFRDNEDPAG